MTDVMLMQADVPSSINAQLKVIQDSGNSLLAIINSILDVSKLSAHMVTLDVHVRLCGARTTTEAGRAWLLGC